MNEWKTTVKEVLSARYKNFYEILNDLVDELYCATRDHNTFNSSHEGYAVIKEELDELWEEVKKKRHMRDKIKMKKEAIQIAAMALRFVLDIC